MNNACPGCGAVYAVAEKDIGRRIACKKCSAALIVGDDGLRYDEEAAPPPARREDEPERERGRDRDRDRDEDRDQDDEDRGSRRRRDRDREETDEERAEREARRARRAAATADIMNKIKGIGDVATWLYSIGLILVIYAKFAGEIDQAKYTGRSATEKEEELDMQIKKREIIEKIKEDKRTEPNSDEEKKLKDIDKEWEKRKSVLADRTKYAEYNKDQQLWWNSHFRVIGFIILAFGAIGYLRPEQSQLKRILGGVTIALILAQVVGGFPLFK